MSGISTLAPQNPIISPYSLRTYCPKHSDFIRFFSRHSSATVRNQRFSDGFLQPDQSKNTACNGVQALSQSSTTAFPAVALPKSWPPSLRILARFLYVYGARISEALDLRFADVNPDGLILLRGSKGSRARIVYFPDILILCGRPQVFSQDKIFYISYRAFYSRCRAAGFSFLSRPGKRNQSVTHAFRVNRIDHLAQSYDITPELLQSFTGHKSLKSLLFYLSPGSASKINLPNKP